MPIYQYKCIRDCFTSNRLHKQGTVYSIDTTEGPPSKWFRPIDGGPASPLSPGHAKELKREEERAKKYDKEGPPTMHEMAKAMATQVSEGPKPESNDTPPPEMTFDQAMDMTNKALREALKLKGLSTNGAKPTLARRLMGLSEVE